jgi:hypothetical protein
MFVMDTSETKILELGIHQCTISEATAPAVGAANK